MPVSVGTYAALIVGLEQAGQPRDAEVYRKEKKRLEWCYHSRGTASLEEILCNCLFDGGYFLHIMVRQHSIVWILGDSSQWHFQVESLLLKCFFVYISECWKVVYRHEGKLLHSAQTKYYSQEKWVKIMTWSLVKLSAWFFHNGRYSLLLDCVRRLEQCTYTNIISCGWIAQDKC